ncbi:MULTISPECIES: aquaporin [Streptomyces]|uniref:aquaporin n=1 Tax=Streptomyces TaxID=1883 RepID=UPI000A3C2221|nr:MULTISPECIES: aquaporin [Streptomyces]MDX3584296.1 aquaporin [Streptomyces europaeiscabiei]MDX3629462.1 aquaporin [Streptomyces europaeiscabiei]MDX3648079.1 aquaporin [Streptomyces europaeiscabiei]
MTAIEESTTGAVPVAVGSVRTPLGARVAAEFVGTAALVTVVVGSGIQATGLTRDVGVQLLANSLATVFGLGVLIVLLGPVSGAHFNPVVTLAEWWTERRSGGVGDPEAAGAAGVEGATGVMGREVAAYVSAQTVGAVAGAVLADAMFAEPLAKWSTHERAAGHLLLAEAVATAGLVLLIFGLARTGRLRFAPVAVASYIGSAYWFTSSTSFANPAVTVGRAFTDTFAGIAPGSVAGFVGAQLVGGAIGLGLVTVIFRAAPAPRPPAS